MRADQSLPLRSHIEAAWQGEVLDRLQDYLRIANVSVAFDPQWRERGHMDRAVELIAGWCSSVPLAGAKVEVIEIDGASPLVLVEVPAFGDADPGAAAAMLYGHLDKQPEMTGWRPDLDPWTPAVEGDRLYGRGGADDGYAAFAALTALAALQSAGGSHRRVVVLIESEEESGSEHLGAYVDLLGDRLGDVDLVVALDSGCIDWERVWITTSLRGAVTLDVTVEVLEEGVHSGDSSGVVPSSMRLMRQLLDRLEDARSGRVLVDSMHAEIPAARVAEAGVTASIAGVAISSHFRFSGTTTPMVNDPVEQILARTWRPTLSYIGADGFPPTSRAGNVLRPATTFALSFRLSPTVDATAALSGVMALLTADPPSGATVRIGRTEAASGWDAPPLRPWLAEALDEASQEVFGQPSATLGEGGSIPFMGMLGERFPQAQFLVTGVLGPGTNAHGPNEFLHLPTATRLTEVVARVLDAHAIHTA